MLSPENITVRLGWDSFFLLENVILIRIACSKPQIYEINISKSWDIDRDFDKQFDKNDEKMMFPDFVQNHFRKVPEAREHVFESI